MQPFTTILLVLMGVTLVISIYLSIRNNMVYAYRTKMIDWTFSDKKAWERRHRYYQSVSYDEMVWKFWKPIRSFYPEYEREKHEES